MSGSQEITRRARADRPAREIHREPEEPAVVIEATGEAPSPEDALEETRRQLADADKRTAESRRLQREAEARARQAEAAAATATAGRATDRQSTVAQMIEAAKAEQSSATAAYRLAREAGDIDAEIAANAALTAANIKLTNASAEHEWLKTQPKQPANPAAGGMSEASRRWLENHPAYNTDRKYRGTAQAAHSEAIQANMPEGSQEYVDFIDRIMTEEYGEGHGQIDDGSGKSPMTQQPARGARPASRGDAAPPSRHTNGSGGGWRSIDTGLGKLEYVDGSDGARKIRFSLPEQKNTFEEGARISRMSLADYANDQIAHALEVAAGGRGDIIIGDGRSYE